MADYMRTAAKANSVAQKLMDLIPAASKPSAAALIAQLANLSFRCNYRGVPGSVRLNVVRKAVESLPVNVRFVPVDNGKGGTFNALEASPIGGEVIVEPADSE